MDLYSFIGSVSLIMLGHIASLAQSQNAFWILNNRCFFHISGITNYKPVNQNFSTCNMSMLSDASGELLFFTDGDTIWNSLFFPMSNGRNLIPDLHNPSQNNSQNSAKSVIIPSPNRDQRYHVFSLWDGSPNINRLYHSIVNMNLANGNGAVQNGQKGQLVNPGAYNSIGVVPGNCDTMWLVTTLEQAGTFHTFPITYTGIGPPNKYALNNGGIISDYREDKIITKSRDYISVCSVDRHTGKIDELYNIPLFESEFCIDACFSEDLSKMYATIHSPIGLQVEQFDLSSDLETTIINSRFELDINPNITSTPNSSAQLKNSHDMELAYNGELYFIQTVSNVVKDGVYISVIEHPNLIRNACQFTKHKIDISDCIKPHFDKLSKSVVFPENYKLPTLGLVDSFICKTDTISIGTPINASRYEWNTGESEARISVSDPGTYTLKAIFNGCPIYDTSTIQGWIPSSEILGNDTILCFDETLLIDISDPNATDYLWSDSLTAVSRLIAEPTHLWAQIADEFCTYRDYIDIQYAEDISFDLGHDTTLCTGDSLHLQIITAADQIQWNTGQSGPAITIIEPGTYRAKVQAGQCTAIDDLVVNYYPKLSLDLGPDTVVCTETTERFETSIDPSIFTDFIWNNGNTQPTNTIDDSGLISIQATDGICWVSDTLLVTFQRCTPCNIYIPNAFSPNGDGVNDSFVVFPNCNLLTFDLKIFDRLGSQIFTSNRLNNEGNEFNGLATGVYVYSIFMEYYQNGQLISNQLVGDVTLIR